MSRFVYISTLLCLLVLSPVQRVFAQDQPNILWIITDDQRADALACYNQATLGQSNSALGYVESPSIDQLASEGVLFTNAYCNSPACAPSRSSMHTGQYPHHSGRYGFEQTHTKHDLNKRTVPEILRSQGYGSAHFGKSGYYIFGWGPGQSYNRLPFYDLHIDHQGELARKGFGDWSRYLEEETFWFPDGSTQTLTRGSYNDLTDAQKKQRDEFDPRLDILRAYTRSNSGLILGGVSPKSAGETTDAYIVKEFLNHLENQDRSYQTFEGTTVDGADSNKPLMIHLGFHFPHTPVLPPESFRKKFRDKRYNIPEFDKSEVDRLPAQLKKHYEQMKIDGMSDADKQTLIQDYYAFCAFGDSLIGEAVKGFKAYCEANDQEYLIVLATGDHGWHLGEQGISAKFGPFDMSNHTAVVVVSSDKQKYPAGTVEEDYLEYVDFAPTFYAEAGIDLSSDSYDYLDGYDLARVVDNSLPARDYVFGEMNSVYGPRAYIRSGDFAFSMRVRDKNDQPSASYPPNNNIMWALTTSRVNVEMALYDLRVDAKERTNLAYVDEYEKLADWFRTKLGNIACGDGRVEVIWSEINTWDISGFALGADDKVLDIPPELIPDVSSYAETTFQVSKKKEHTVAPLPDARIRINSQVLFTDSLGLARVFLKEGAYGYTIEAKGFVSVADSIKLSPEQTVFFDTLEHEYYNLSLQLVDKTNLDPVEGAEVNFADMVRYSDTEGKVYYDSLIYGEYALNVEAENYLPVENQTLGVDQSAAIQIKLAPQPYPQKIILLNQWNQVPVENAAITIDDQGQTSDENGKAIFELAPGSHSIRIEKDKYSSFTTTIETEKDSTHHFLLFQEKADAQFRIKGQGSPLSGAEIFLDGDTLQTGAGGTVTFYKLNVDSPYPYTILHKDFSPYMDELFLHTDSLIQIFLSPVSVNGLNDGDQVTLFPNPFHNQFTISGFGESDLLIISDLKGRILLTQKIEGPEAKVKLSFIPEGIYLLRLEELGLVLKILKE